MKFLLLFSISILLSGIIKAQLPDDTKYAKIIDIQDENNIVIAKMTIISGLRNEICLKSYSHTRDSTGFYITEYTFMRPGHLQTKNVTLILQFNKQFENVYFNTEGEVENIKTTIADNKIATSFHASNLAIDAIIFIKVISKKPALATITGIAGQLRQKEQPL